MKARWKWSIIAILVLAFIGFNTITSSIFDTVGMLRYQKTPSTDNYSEMHRDVTPSMMSNNQIRNHCRDLF